MSTKKNIQTKLRFKDNKGNNYPNWEVKKLGEVGTFFSGGTPLTTKRKYFDGKIPFIRSGEINANKTAQFISEEGLKNSSAKMVEVGDLIYALYGATSGEVGISKINGAINQAILCIRTNMDNRFLHNYLLLKKESIIKTYLQGGQGNLSAEIIKSLEVPIPSKEEQTKIANFLSAIDEKIDNLQKELDELKQYKKGVMQAIFSNVNENGGGWNDFQKSFKFKDEKGKDFPKWEKKKFGEVFTFRTTNSFSRENLNYEFGTIKNIHYGDIHTKFNSHFDITKEYVPFVNPEIELKKIDEDNYCKEGDLIIADASEDYEDVGKTIEIVNLNKQKVLAGLHTIQARPNLSKMAIGFNGHLMKSESVRLQIKTIAQGSKVLSISATRLANISIDIPCLKEQTKIANFLSAIDDKIKITQNEMQHTQQYKKGLMQQMFASA